MVNYGEVGRPKKIQGDVDASYQSQIGLEVAVAGGRLKSSGHGVLGKRPNVHARSAPAHDEMTTLSASR